MTKTQKLTRTILSSVALLVLCDVAGVANQSLLISGAQAQKAEAVPTARVPGFKTPGLQEKWEYIYDHVTDGTLQVNNGCHPVIDTGAAMDDPSYQVPLQSFTYLRDIVINTIKKYSDNYKSFKQDFSKLPKQENLKTVQDWQANLDEQTRLLGLLNVLIDNVAMDVNLAILGAIPGCKPDHDSVRGILNSISVFSTTAPDQGSGFTNDDALALDSDTSWYPLLDDFYPTDAKAPDPESVYQHKYLLPLQQGIALAQSKIAELGGGNAPGGQQGAPVDDGKQATLPTDVSDAELDAAIERFKNMTPEQRDVLPAEEKDLYGAKLDYDLKKQQADDYKDDYNFPPGISSKTELMNSLKFATNQLKDSRDALNAYLAKHGRGADGFVINAQKQPLFLMSAEAFAKEFGGAASQPVSTPAFQYSDTIPCGKLSSQVVGRIVKGADKMKPGNSNDIKAFKAALDATFNESNNMKPIGSKFYDNLVEWIEDKSMTDEKHQLLNYTINQLDILTSSEPKDVFDFSKVYSEYNKTIGNDAIVKAKNGDFQKGWMDFYNDTLKNSKERNIDALYRLMMNMYYTRINKGEPQDSPSMQAMKRIIDKLQRLHLEKKCSKK